jgi:hypothetical protein
MKKNIFAVGAIAAASLISSTAAFAVQPIEGSIIYNGQPSQKLEKSPIGSTLTHEFENGGERYVETYILQADRSLKLVNRTNGNSN